MLIIQGLLITFFLFASSIKILGWIKAVYEPQLAFFYKYGLNRASMVAVGIIEATGAIGMLVGMITEESLLSAFGAGLIALTSIGAMYFHFKFDTWKEAIPSMLTLLFSLLLLSPLLELVINR
ncbi:DoxX family protein [Vibrio sp. 99-8-1]|uniref:DoxX family protein n=1 Tax=Vibrio sp. 99-8-1 TaxID=2607602 RepID=UPI00149396D0|nr:DoxX family protein [Vibrio sp. 99-8-1]NOI65197.1 DoxX family protein [Vibrio sp. 99-8-1]